jgi:protein CLEC16A
LLGEKESQLPLNSKIQQIAELDDCINLNDSDLLACYVSSNRNEKASRFLVTDRYQLILVEPDKKKLGWGVVRFSGLLQDTHVSGDPTDGKSLHVVVEDVKCRIKSKASPQLSAKLIFDDHIRCMAAKQRLGKVSFKMLPN